MVFRSGALASPRSLHPPNCPKENVEIIHYCLRRQVSTSHIVDCNNRYQQIWIHIPQSWHAFTGSLLASVMNLKCWSYWVLNSLCPCYLVEHLSHKIATHPTSFLQYLMLRILTPKEAKKTTPTLAFPVMALSCCSKHPTEVHQALVAFLGMSLIASQDLHDFLYKSVNQ